MGPSDRDDGVLVRRDARARVPARVVTNHAFLCTVTPARARARLDALARQQHAREPAARARGVRGAHLLLVAHKRLTLTSIGYWSKYVFSVSTQSSQSKIVCFIPVVYFF